MTRKGSNPQPPEGERPEVPPNPPKADWLAAMAVNGPESTADLLQSQHETIAQLNAQLTEALELAGRRVDEIERLSAEVSRLDAELKHAQKSNSDYRASIHSYRARLAKMVESSDGESRKAAVSEPDSVTGTVSSHQESSDG